MSKIWGALHVLLDFRREQDEEMRRFKMQWSFDYSNTWIKTRGRSDDSPFGVIIDEFAHMTQKVVSGSNPLAQELNEFINVYMRQHTIWFTAAHQELYQIDEQLRNTLLSLGTYIIGGTSSMDSARDLADALYFRSPYKVKDYEPVYGRSYPHRPLEIIDLIPIYMPLEEQTELFANRIKKLGRFQFLLRPAVAEGHIGSEVLPMTIRDVDRDRITGEYQFPEQPLVQRVRAALAKQSGIPVQRLLAEQEKRLSQAPRHHIPAPPQDGKRPEKISGSEKASAQPTPEPLPALPAGRQNGKHGIRQRQRRHYLS